MDPSSRHIDAARARLAHLGGVAGRTHTAEQAILESAQHRRAVVDSDLDKLRPRTSYEESAAEQYMALTQERGQLDIVIGRAQQNLAVPE